MRKCVLCLMTTICLVIWFQTSELFALGVDVALIGIDQADDRVIIQGNGKVANIIRNQPAFFDDILNSTSNIWYLRLCIKIHLFLKKGFRHFKKSSGWHYASHKLKKTSTLYERVF